VDASTRETTSTVGDEPGDELGDALGDELEEVLVSREEASVEEGGMGQRAVWE
jgi:hypothetical protein